MSADWSVHFDGAIPRHGQDPPSQDRQNQRRAKAIAHLRFTYQLDDSN
jgi:hypothetical protein